ncbi:hypothetical protein [Devosia sp. RR2S18]|uniref:hypothetical protein n=1 Tax=Devosia rhizosphaerae TaxID=3049774 RepID=UPI0025422572|nr:hypothetical protein [Devosia sp. RR2S18]WIJ24119.1 hypothetical protein QOV41_13985 [Devosia sp. RR2S18]
MKSSIFALATAAALSLGMSSVALAQDATTLLEPVVEGCPINTEGVETESGVATPTGESLVDEGDDDMDGGDLDDGQIPVDECEDGEFTGIGDGAIDGTVDADDSGADSLTN